MNTDSHGDSLEKSAGQRYSNHEMDRGRGYTDQDGYRQLVDSSSQGIFFCHRWWLDTVCPGEYEILTVEANGQVQAAWPVVWRKRWGLRWIAMPALTQKLGILFAPSEAKYAERLSREHRLAEALIAQLPGGTRIASHNFHETFESWLPFHWVGFQQTTRYTYILEDTSDLELIWHGLRPAVRKDIRKSEKAGIRVRETEDLQKFYHVESLTFRRQSLANPVPFGLLERVYAACKANANVRMTVAEDEQGRAHAVLFAIFDSRCMVLLMSGGDPELRGDAANTLLHWDAIQFGSSVCRRFDFEGSMMKSIEQFYRGFGARLTPYSSISGVLGTKPAGWLRRRAGEVLHRIGDFVGRRRL